MEVEVMETSCAEICAEDFDIFESILMPEGETKFSICCEVCAEEFSHEESRVPKLISCGHSFCESCLTKLERINHFGGQNIVMRGRSGFVHKRTTYTITCPKCKEESVSKKPCTSLPKNYGYLDLIDEVLESEKKKPICCEEHPNYVLDMFCHDEEEAVCLYCASYGDHKEHSVSRLSGFADHQKTSIRYRLEDIGRIISGHEELADHLEAKEQEMVDKVEYIRKNIISKFESVKTAISRILDDKLEAVLNQLSECSVVQLSLLESAKENLNTQELEDVQNRGRTFLSEADECSMAKENVLLCEMEAKIDEAQSHNLCTAHVYEVQLDSADHIVQSLGDLVDAWACRVRETKGASVESIASVVDRYSPSYGDSINILFGEKQPYEQLTENPFAAIDCKFWCDGVLVYSFEGI